MNLSIATVHQIVFSGEVKSISFPSALFPFQVLAGHGPMVSSLGRGSIAYMKGDSLYSFPIQYGFVSIAHDQVSVVCAVIETKPLAPAR